MRIFIVPIYTSMVLSHSSMQQIILILVALFIPCFVVVQLCFSCCRQSRHLSPAVGSRAIVKVGAVVLC